MHGFEPRLTVLEAAALLSVTDTFVKEKPPAFYSWRLNLLLRPEDRYETTRQQ